MNIKKIVALLLAIALAGGMLASCARQKEETKTEGFDYSSAFDSEGYFKDVKASDYVTLPDYSAYKMPAEYTTASQEDIDRRLEALKNKYKTQEKDTDTSREIADGDKVNIDYVGKVDGEEFEGGSTEGKGTDVTIGVTNYIEGFLDQLVGHKAGENFDISVPFPEDYENEELKGKDAVFNITINHIYKDVYPEINDEFIKENSTIYSSLKEYTDALSENIIYQQKAGYIVDKIMEETDVSSYPQHIIDYYKALKKNEVEQQASYYGMEVDEMLSIFYEYEDIDSYMADMEELIKEEVKFYLIVQAIAEEKGIKVQNTDIAEFFENQQGSSDYSYAEAIYGKPYLKYKVMGDMVINDLIENMEVEE